MFHSDIKGLRLAKRGKVRDVYDLGEFYLFVASDRISAFDLVMNQTVPGKGRALCAISQYWFEETRSVIRNHFISSDAKDFPAPCHHAAEQLAGRSMLVEKCEPLAVECIARGYLAGSGYKEYKAGGTVCGIRLPAKIPMFGALPEPIYTPSTKAEEGRDENISFEKTVDILGAETAEKLKRYTLELFDFASKRLQEKGIILADAKLEFGISKSGEITLIDEAFTPDSSRFWLAERYSPGKEQYNFDKQILRDWLESSGWNKQPPPPELPEEIIRRTSDKYAEILKIILTNENG